MGTKTCPSCFGTGGYHATESKRNTGPGPLYVPVNVRKRCQHCGGSGTVFEPDPPKPSTAQPGNRKAPPPSSPSAGAGGLDHGSDGSGSAVGSAAVIGVIVALVLGLSTGASVLGLILVGALAGALLVPVLRFTVWITVGLLKFAFWAAVIFFGLAVLAAIFG